ncbi:MAG TPA: MarR family transcriptional regulator [Steroidobacteraceae bacterium]|nr:MarR family transcriptional regulator [Steroidobacteraceae bacterium]
MDRLRNLGFLIKDVSQLWARYFESHADQIGLTLTQAKVLVYLSRNEGCTQARLAELCDTDPMTLVRVLDRMETDGFLERRPDPSDRRVYRLFLKPSSDPILAEITRIGDKARGEVLAGLSTEERGQLIVLLERVHANLLALTPTASEPARASAPTNSSARRGRRTPDAPLRRRKTSP